MAQGELRLPLQVGTSSLAGFARAAATFFPGLLLIGSIALPALLAPWDDAAEVYPHLIVPYAFALFAAAALLAYARKHFGLAFRERPSDVVFAGDMLRIDGGPMNGWECAFVDIQAARVVGRHEKLELVEDEGSKKSENFWQLVLELKDGSKKRLGSAEDVKERDSLQALADSIKASLKQSAGGAASQKEPEPPLKCRGCGAPAEPSDQEVVPCKYCNTPIRMPEDVRTRIHAMKQRRVSDERANKLVQKLVNQPGALRTSFFVFLAAIPSLLVWPAAIVFAGVLYALCYLRAGNGILLVMASYGVIFALYFLVRGQLTDRQALRLLTLGFAARAPKEAGGASHCRQCNGPLIAQQGNVLVRCAYCGAENVLGLDMRGAAYQSKEQVESLDDALFRRKSERARWRFSAFIAIVVLVIVAVLVRISAHPPNPLKAIADAKELKRITYDPFNEFQPKVSPDGKSLLYDLRVPGEDSDESIMSAPATGAFRGTEMTMEKVHAIRPLWMNDGKGFLYISSTKRDVLRRVDSLVPYGTARDLYSFDYDIDVPSMAPDGNHFAFAAANTKSSGWYLYIGALDGSQSRQITAGINPAWSPDGSHIAYSRTIGQHRQINAMILDGTTMVTTSQLTNDTCDHEDPVYSPDGQYIAYVGNCGGNTRGKKNIWDLYVMRADGTQNEQLTDGKADVETPAWSGDHIYFSADIAGNYDIWRVRLTGTLAGHGTRATFVAPIVQQIPAWMLPKQDWAGSYNCSQGPTSAVLHISSVSNDSVDGTFDFKYAGNGNTVAGQFKVHGKMTATGDVDFDAGDWIVRPKGWNAVGFKGTISDNKLYTGTMKSPNCTTFSFLRK